MNFAVVFLAFLSPAIATAPHSFDRNECNATHPCAVDEGDCDTDDDCQTGLHCGYQQCNSTAMPNDYDCCLTATCNDFSTNDTLKSLWNCCGRKNGTCGENEGDCDSDDECQTGMKCYPGSCNVPVDTPEVYRTGLDCCQLEKCDGGPHSEDCCALRLARNLTCGVGEGDCDNDDECETGLICLFGGCGRVNNFDCCAKPARIGNDRDWNACTESSTCAVNQGDCDNDDQCGTGLICGWGYCATKTPNNVSILANADCCKPDGGCDASNTAWDCCTTTNKCSAGQGDCDSHDECLDGLYCGNSTWCGNSGITLEPTANCCYEQACDGSLAAMDCCYPTRSPKCAEGQGDCDVDDDCAPGLKCGKQNCNGALADSEADCCYKP